MQITNNYTVTHLTSFTTVLVLVTGPGVWFGGLLQASAIDEGRPPGPLTVLARRGTRSPDIS